MQSLVFSPRTPPPGRVVLISDLAKRLGVTARALRHYQEIGLVRAQRLSRNVRGYNDEAVARIQTIITFREVDMPLSVIAEILALEHDASAQAARIQAALQDLLDDNRAKAARLESMLAAQADSERSSSGARQ